MFTDIWKTGVLGECFIVQIWVLDYGKKSVFFFLADYIVNNPIHDLTIYK